MGVIRYSKVVKDYHEERYIRIDKYEYLSSWRIRHLLKKHSLEYVVHGVGPMAKDYYNCPGCNRTAWVYFDTLVGVDCLDCQKLRFTQMRSYVTKELSTVVENYVQTTSEARDDVIIRDEIPMINYSANAKIKNDNLTRSASYPSDSNKKSVYSELRDWKRGCIKIDFDELGKRNELLIRMTIKSCPVKISSDPYQPSMKHFWIEMETRSGHHYSAQFHCLHSNKIMICMRQFRSVIGCNIDGLSAAGQKYDPLIIWNEPFCKYYNNSARSFCFIQHSAPTLGTVIDWIRADNFLPFYHFNKSNSKHFANAMFAAFCQDSFDYFLSFIICC